jgi:hypothetical protein
MTNFEDNTKTLKTLIKKTKKSGKQAWEAGEILNHIFALKEYKEKYKTFNSYTSKEFDIKEETAQQYITIYKKIPIDMITDKMLVSHLYTIAEMQDILKVQILGILRLEEDESKVTYDGDIVLIFKQVLEQAKSSLSDKEAKELFKFIKKLDLQENERRKRAKNNPLERAERLETILLHKNYKSLTELYHYSPISEQGLVGLFCTNFHLIKQETFHFNDIKSSFEAIIYIRTEYPDAQILIKKEVRDIDIYSDHNNYQKINIEFELNSFNYWRHKHHESESSEKCDMIICWEIDKIPTETVSTPILCIKELLETGKIELH